MVIHTFFEQKEAVTAEVFWCRTLWKDRQNYKYNSNISISLNVPSRLAKSWKVCFFLCSKVPAAVLERLFDSTTPKQYTFKPDRRRPVFIAHPVLLYRQGVQCSIYYTCYTWYWLSCITCVIYRALETLLYILHTINSTIKGTLWGTLGIDPRFLKGSVKSFYHAKMLVGAY